MHCILECLAFSFPSLGLRLAQGATSLRAGYGHLVLPIGKLLGSACLYQWWLLNETKATVVWMLAFITDRTVLSADVTVSLLFCPAVASLPLAYGWPKGPPAFGWLRLVMDA